MANSIGVLTNQEIAIYSDNILNKFLTFPDAFTWNIVSGGVNGVADNNSVNTYAGKNALLVSYTDVGTLVFNSGGAETDIVIPKDGNYILSYRFFKDNPTAICNYTVKVFINGISFDYATIDQELSTANGFVDDKWNTFFQYIPLVEDDVVSFQFETDCDTVGTKVSMGGLKLELVDRALTLPSLYTAPLDIVILKDETLDFPSVSSNGTEELTFTMTGAKVGDFIQMVVPVASYATGLIYGMPDVIADDTVKVVVHNATGGAINPASGVFKFKIVR